MSQWTHVAGAIRIDATRTVLPTSVQLIEDLIGYSYYHTDDGGRCENGSPGPLVPSGSEGPIQYIVHENPMLASMAAYNVLIWGDLRDYENVDEIGDWLARIVHQVNGIHFGNLLAIRALYVGVDVELRSNHLFYLDNEGKLEMKSVWRFDSDAR